jgi:hypothetical protein
MGRYHLGELDTDGRTTLTYLKETGYGSGYSLVTGACEYDNEPSGFIKCTEIS